MERRIALVTGGNRRIGYETCKELARLGSTPCISSCQPHFMLGKTLDKINKS